MKKILFVLALILLITVAVFTVSATFEESTQPDEYHKWKETQFDIQPGDVPQLLAAAGYIKNAYIEAYINEEAHYTIGTVAGNPTSSADDSQKLLFGHPDSSTTETLLVIDDDQHFFYSNNNVFSADGKSVVSTATVDDVTIKQTLSLQYNAYTQREDVVEIRYDMINNSSATKLLGGRIMLDTMCGSNDGAPFKISGIGNVTYEREFVGNAIPQYWQAFDSLSNPSVISTGTFYRNVSQRPDKVQFAYWGDIRSHSWNYVVSSSKSLTGDSAVAAYFNPKATAPGATRTFVTYYGLSDITTIIPPDDDDDDDDDTDEGNITFGITGDLSEMTLNENEDGYTDNPFTLTVHVVNTRDTDEDITLTINLPEPLTTDNNVIEFTSEANSESTVSWQIDVEEQFTDAEFEYSIDIETSYFTAKEERTIYLPAVSVLDPEDLPYIKVNGDRSRAGKYVDVAIDIGNNPGIVSMLLNLEYSDKLTLTAINDGDIFGEAIHDVADIANRPYVFSWAEDTATQNNTSNGTIVTLTFEVSEDAVKGEFLPITISYDNNDAGIYDIDMNLVDFEVINSGIEVISYIVGDLNDDGSVNSFDRTILARHIANWVGYSAYDFVYEAADVNVDGEVNSFDRTILTRHVANWEGYETLPYGVATTYTLSFGETDGGVVNMNVAGSYAKNSVVNLNAIPYEGYVFVRWESDNGGVFANAEASSTTFTMPANNVQVRAIFDPIPKYTVEFDLNYDSMQDAPETQAVNEGECAAKPADPVREDYEFCGWFTDIDCTEEFDFEALINSDITLYAKWEKIIAIELTANESVFFTDAGDATVYLYARMVNVDSPFASVTLYDEYGNPLASLFDDGQYSENGDEFSNDNIYTCYIELPLEYEETYKFRVIGSGTTTIASNEFEIEVVASMTYEQIENMNIVDTVVQEEIFMEDGFEEMSLEERMDLANNVINELVDEGLIDGDTVVINEDNGSYTFLYESGALGSIILRDWNEDQNGAGAVNVAMPREEIDISARENNAQNSVMLMDADDDYADIDAEAIILWSFNQAWDSSSYRRPFYTSVEQDWESKGIDTTVVWETTVDNYKDLADYEIIVFSGHGDFDTYTFSTAERSMSSLILHEVSTPDKDTLYRNDLRAFNIGRITVSGGTMYAILPDFWNAYYDVGDFDGSFVFAENCEFYGEYGTVNNEMANAILELSAESVIGFHNSVMADYSRNLMKFYFDELIEGSTTYEAIEAAKDEYGDDDYFVGREDYGPTAYPIFSGESDSVLVNNSFENGSFEATVAFSGWKRQGDVRLLTKLGALVPTHQNKMAILTTGIGSGTSGYMEATEGSILYQTFRVPADATVLTFDYDVVSEEPMEYVGTKYDDKFFVEIITVDDGNAAKVVEESVNESVWHAIGNINFDGGDDTTYHTGWKSVTVDLSEYRNQMVTLRFVVYDVGDSVYDTATLVDNIRISE